MFKLQLLTTKRFIFRGPPSLDFNEMMYSLDGKNPQHAEKLVETFKIEIQKASPSELGEALKRYEEQWYKDFLKAGFDIRQNKKLPNYNAEKVKQMNELLDKMITILNKQFERLTANQERLKSRISRFNTSLESALAKAFETKVDTQKPPVFRVELNNRLKSTLRIRTLDSFDPKGEPGSKIDLRQARLAGPLNSPARLNLRTTILADKKETPANEGIQAIARYLINDYFPKYPKILQAFGIKDIRNITPRQAVKLASYIPMERLKYSTKQVDRRDSLENEVEADINDTVPIEKLFKWDQGEDGNGVCRNYAEVAMATLDALKLLQNPQSSLINNLHGITLGYKERWSTTGFVTFHAWNGFVHVNKDGSMDAIVLDPTWGDDDSIGADPARGAAKALKLDFSEDRYFTLIANFEIAGLISPLKHAEQIAKAYSTVTDYEFPAMTEDNYPYLTRAWPKEHALASRLMQILESSLPKTPAINSRLEKIIEKFIKHIEKAGKQIINSVKKFPKKKEKIIKRMLPRFLKDIQNTIDAINWSQIPTAQKTRLKGELKRIISEFYKTMPDQINRTVPLYLKISDALGLEKIKARQIELIEKDPNFSDRALWLKIYSGGDPSQDRIRNKLFGVKEKSLVEQAFNFHEIEDSTIESWSNTNKSNFYKRVKRAISWLNIEKRNFKRSKLYITNDARNSYDINTLFLAPNMSEEEMREKLRVFWEHRSAWEEILQLAPTTLRWLVNVDEKGPLSKTEMETFLQNAKDYFSTVREDKVKYKNIWINKSMNYAGSNSWIHINLFLKANFNKISKIISSQKVGYDLSPEKLNTISLEKDAHEFAQKTAEIDGIKIEIKTKLDRTRAEKILRALKREMPNISKKYPGLKKHPLRINILGKDSFWRRKMELQTDNNMEIPCRYPARNVIAFIKRNIPKHIKLAEARGRLKEKFKITGPSWSADKLTARTQRALENLEKVLEENAETIKGFSDIEFEEISSSGMLEIDFYMGPHERRCTLKFNPSISSPTSFKNFIKTLKEMDQKLLGLEKRYQVKFIHLDQQITSANSSKLRSQKSNLEAVLENVRNFLNRDPEKYIGYNVSLYELKPSSILKAYPNDRVIRKAR